MITNYCKLYFDTIELITKCMNKRNPVQAAVYIAVNKIIIYLNSIGGNHTKTKTWYFLDS